ncbi:MAG TPA: hypothetical protein DIC28_05795 [Aerococcus urinaeequi]|nr:hypothetical protein [Aerococcus urinaeequi]
MNIQERIEALETEFNEKIKALKAEVQREDEFPQYNDTYYYIESNGRVDWFKWDEGDYDLEAQGIGNIFRTEEQAEFAAEKLKVEAELRKFSIPFEEDEYNSFINLYMPDKTVAVDGCMYWQKQGVIYFESDNKAQQAIEAVGEERIKKYIFGVED